MKNKLDNLSAGKIVEIREKLLKRQANGEPVYRLESGDPHFNISDNCKMSIISSLFSNKTHYIPNLGIPELRKEIVNKLKSQNIDANFNQICITNGAMNGLFVLFQSLIDETSIKNEIILPDPEQTEITENIILAGGNPVSCQLDDKWHMTYDNVKKLITSNTLAVFLNNPNNPTGGLTPSSEIKKIINLCKELGIYCITDEAYESIIFDDDKYSPLQDDYEKIIGVFSMSKRHAMPGLRVGYLVIREAELMDSVGKLLRCTINGVNSLAQQAAIEALKNDDVYIKEQLKIYTKNRNIIYNALLENPYLEPYLPQGSFFIWCKVKDIDVNTFCDVLINKGIGVVPGEAFSKHFTNYVRFSFSCDTQMLIDGLEKMKHIKYES